MKIHHPFLLCLFFFTYCKSDNDQAQQIVDQTIEKAGGENYSKAAIEFDFRDLHYRSERNDGLYTYSRFREDSLGTTVDILSNEGFIRKINGKEAFVHDTMKVKYSNSVNSVIYFAVLPYGLNDEAVNKQYLGNVKIDGNEYHKIKVSFDEVGGGEDHQDIFVYWINADSLTIDYLAYKYFTEGGGQRFRKAYNPRYINGIRFVDYKNYKPSVRNDDFIKIDSLYKTGSLEQISEIKLENVEVYLNE